MLAGNKISVRALVEFAARRGDLHRQFSPSPSAASGIEGHLQVQRSRPDSYQAEVPLQMYIGDLLISGRADGYDKATQCIEEIKTLYGSAENVPDNQRSAHWAQAKMYAWMQCWRLNLRHIKVALVYFDLNEERQYRLEQLHARTELDKECHGWVLAFLRWQNLQQARQRNCQQQLTKLVFPYPQMHRGQRLMSESVYKACVTGSQLLSEAPTGTGKTLATLFAALKAKSAGQIQRIFFLTAKTTGQHAAEDSLALLKKSAQALRSVTLSAQQRACLHSEVNCRGDVCPYARGFYDKLPKVREHAARIPLLTASALADLGQQYEICPYYLAVEMARWCEVVVADMNYYFDITALLYALQQQFEWKVGLLIDECHNLVERGRMMYSAQLQRQWMLDSSRQVKGKLQQALKRVNRHWLAQVDIEPEQSYQPVVAINDELLAAMQDVLREYSAQLQHSPDDPSLRGVMQDVFFQLNHFITIYGWFDEDYALDWQPGVKNKGCLTLRNISPARLLAERFKHSHSAVLFSATLQPFHFYQQLLGIPEAKLQVVESPFDANQLSVFLHPRLSLRYQHRQQAIFPICQIVAEQLRQTPGNAMLFVPSYGFLDDLLPILRDVIAGLNVELIAQQRDMNNDQKADFLRQYNHKRNVLGLVVLGGVFSEGVDLPGEQLTGVFIASLGLPQYNPINQMMEQKLQRLFNDGYRYTYLYPGLQKVVQAAGRVIRTVNDTGYVHLLDNRFIQADIQQLLPDWWSTPKV